MNTYKSGSDEQQYAGHVIFKEIERILAVPLQENVKIYLSDNKKIHIEPDFYSGDNCIVGEIFARVGSYKVGQRHKVAGDILKMLLLENVRGKKFRKMLVVCSDEEKNKLEQGASWLSESVRQFGIEVVKIDIPKELEMQIIEAQKRQKMVNA